jgi:hypothetical protein
MRRLLLAVLALTIVVAGNAVAQDSASGGQSPGGDNASASYGSRRRAASDSSGGVWTDFGPGGLPSRRFLDADGRGLTVKTGNVVRGFREDGYRYWIVRDGNWERYGDNQGTVGTTYFDDKRQVMKFEYRVPLEGYRVVGENPYPSNTSARPWSRRIRLSR